MKVKSGKYNLNQYDVLLEGIEHIQKIDSEKLKRDSTSFISVNNQIIWMLESHLKKFPIGISKFGDNYKSLDLYIPPEPKEGDEGFAPFASLTLYFYSDEEYQKMMGMEKWIIRQGTHCDTNPRVLSREQVISNFPFHMKEGFTKKGVLKDCQYLGHLTWNPNTQNPKINCLCPVWSSRQGRSEFKYEVVLLEKLDSETQQKILKFVQEKLENDSIFLNQYLK